jgi:hypothetical protein
MGADNAPGAPTLCNFNVKLNFPFGSAFATLRFRLYHRPKPDEILIAPTMSDVKTFSDGAAARARGAGTQLGNSRGVREQRYSDISLSAHKIKGSTRVRNR